MTVTMTTAWAFLMSSHREERSAPELLCAICIGEHTGAYPSYQAAPSFAYLIGDYTLDRTGTLAGPKNDYLIRALAEDGYQTK